MNKKPVSEYDVDERELPTVTIKAQKNGADVGAMSQLRDQCGTQEHNLREAYRVIGEQNAKIDAQAATIRRLEGKPR